MFDVRVYALFSEFSSPSEFGNVHRSGITKVWVHRSGFSRVYSDSRAPAPKSHGGGDILNFPVSRHDDCSDADMQNTRSLDCILYSFFEKKDRGRVWLSIRRAVGKAVLALREPLSTTQSVLSRCPAGSCYQIIRADLVIR